MSVMLLKYIVINDKAKGVSYTRAGGIVYFKKGAVLTGQMTVRPDERAKEPTALLTTDGLYVDKKDVRLIENQQLTPSSKVVLNTTKNVKYGAVGGAIIGGAYAWYANKCVFCYVAFGLIAGSALGYIFLKEKPVNKIDRSQLMLK